MDCDLARHLLRFARPGCTTTWVGRNEVRVSQDGLTALVSLRDATDSGADDAISAHGCVIRVSPV